MKTVTIVIDCQNDFITGALPAYNAQDALPRIKEVIQAARGPLYFTMDTHNLETYSSSREGHIIPSHCFIKTEGWFVPNELWGARQLRQHLGYPEEGIYFKSSFGCPSLWEKVISDKPDSIVIVGFCTDICVITNALALRTMLPNTPITVYSNCCAGTSLANHNAALDIMQNNLIEIKEWNTND